jgi:hypothetical protein
VFVGAFGVMVASVVGSDVTVWRTVSLTQVISGLLLHPLRVARGMQPIVLLIRIVPVHGPLLRIRGVVLGRVVLMVVVPRVVY